MTKQEILELAQTYFGDQAPPAEWQLQVMENMLASDRIRVSEGRPAARRLAFEWIWMTSHPLRPRKACTS